MIRKEEVYKIGRIGKPHGVHGELQMQFSMMCLMPLMPIICYWT